jgi:hypothetical protein
MEKKVFATEENPSDITEISIQPWHAPNLIELSIRDTESGTNTNAYEGTESFAQYAPS